MRRPPISLNPDHPASGSFAELLDASSKAWPKLVNAAANLDHIQPADRLALDRAPKKRTRKRK